MTTVLLVAAGSTVTALLIGERSAAAETATLDAREDREHERLLTDLVTRRDQVENAVSAAQATGRAAQSRVDAAEAERRAAQEEVEAREQAAAEAKAADEQEFADLMRDDMPGVADVELVSRGRAVCTYLDATGGDVYVAIDQAAAEYGDEASIPLVAAAVVMFCPEHD